MAGFVVGAIAGAVTAVAINGIWNTIDKKSFFEGWQNAALQGAIAGGIAGLSAAYSAQNATSNCGNKLAFASPLWQITPLDLLPPSLRNKPSFLKPFVKPTQKLYNHGYPDSEQGMDQYFEDVEFEKAAQEGRAC